jgi:hypothetical protein
MFDLGLDNAIKHACLCHLTFFSKLENSMFKRNQIQKTLLVSALTLSAVTVIAQETVTSQASVTVQNAFNLVEVAPISFGTVTVAPGPTEVSSLVIQPDGVTDVTTASDGTFSVITAGTPGQYTVDSAASFTNLTVTNTTTLPLELANQSANSSNGKFELSAFTFLEDGTAGGGAVSATIETDLTGTLAFNVGATLTVPSAAGTVTYVDGNYVGNYTLQVAY